MDLKFLLVISAVILASLLVNDVQGQRRGNGGGGRGGKRPGATRGSRYHWTRDLGAGHASEEEAFAITEKHLIFFKSSHRNLTAAGFTKSTTLYDFSTTPPVLAISILGRGRQSPCYVTNTTSTYQEVYDTLTTRNGLTAPLGSQVSLDGSGDQLIREYAQVLLASNPALRRVCKGGKIVRAASTAAAANDTTEAIKVLTVDNEVILTIPTLSQRSRNGNRRGGAGGRRNRNPGQN